MAFKAIVKQVLDGDKDAFRVIVVEYGPSVRAFLAGNLSDPGAVDDLAQETFIAAYESLATFDADADPGPWLKGIARNLLLMHWRHVHQHGNALERLKTQALEAVFENLCQILEPDTAGTLQKLRQCLSKLPERVRSVIQARHLEREKVASIASRLETSVTAISALLFRGRKQLEACIEGRR